VQEEKDFLCDIIREMAELIQFLPKSSLLDSQAAIVLQQTYHPLLDSSYCGYRQKSMMKLM